MGEKIDLSQETLKDASDRLWVRDTGRDDANNSYGNIHGSLTPGVPMSEETRAKFLSKAAESLRGIRTELGVENYPTIWDVQEPPR